MSLSWLLLLAPLSFEPTEEMVVPPGDPEPDAVMGAGLGAGSELTVTLPTQAASWLKKGSVWAM